MTWTVKTRTIVIRTIDIRTFVILQNIDTLIGQMKFRKLRLIATKSLAYFRAINIQQQNQPLKIFLGIVYIIYADTYDVDEKVTQRFKLIAWKEKKAQSRAKIWWKDVTKGEDPKCDIIEMKVDGRVKYPDLCTMANAVAVNPPLEGATKFTKKDIKGM